MAELQRTRLNPRWLVKMAIGLVVLTGLGFYGLYDAIVAYPTRGVKVALFEEHTYLSAAVASGALSNRAATVQDPVNEQSRLKDRGIASLTELENARLRWLNALAMIGKLKPDYTTIPRPGLNKTEFTNTAEVKPIDMLKAPVSSASSRNAQLDVLWAESNPPSTLNAYDIPFQWLVVLLGFAGALWMLQILLRTAMVSYRWNSDTLCLHLPGSVQLLPTDITEFDKRKWDKFLIFLRIGENHDRLAGKTIRLDLLRHEPLEEWILAMEKSVHGSQEESDEAQSDTTAAQAESQESAEPTHEPT